MYDENILKDINRNDTFDIKVFLEFMQDKGIIEVRNMDKLPVALDDWNEEAQS